MPITLIEQKPSFDKKVEGVDKLAIAEMFCDTLQGEGVSTGVVSTFMRLQGCTLKCAWCDTLDVWPHGNEYHFREIFALMDNYNLADRLKQGQHLILTGGSPLKQQEALVRFIKAFQVNYGFKPYIECENEAVLSPSADMLLLVDQWNNSPKLANSGMKHTVRVKPEILMTMNALPKSWFKFVVRNNHDWQEIVRDYIEPGYISKHKVILMPEGQAQKELEVTRPIVASIAIENNVKFTDRLHITIWDKKTGV